MFICVHPWFLLDSFDEPRRFFCVHLAGARLDRVEDVALHATRLADLVAERLDDLVEARADRRVRHADLLRDLFQVAAGEHEHLDEPLMLHREAGEPRHRERGVHGDGAVRARHPRHRHPRPAVRTVLTDRALLAHGLTFTMSN